MVHNWSCLLQKTLVARLLSTLRVSGRRLVLVLLQILQPAVAPHSLPLTYSDLLSSELPLFTASELPLPGSSSAASFFICCSFCSCSFFILSNRSFASLASDCFFSTWDGVFGGALHCNLGATLHDASEMA